MATKTSALAVHLDTSQLRFYRDAPDNYCHFVLGNLFEVFVGLHEHGLLEAEIALTHDNPSPKLSQLYSVFSALPVRNEQKAPAGARTVVLTPSANWTTLERSRDLGFYMPLFREHVARRIGCDVATPSQLTLVQRNPLFGNRYAINEAQLIAELRSYCAEHALELQVVDFAELTFAQQVEAMARTAVLVGVHGAGLVNSLFLPKGSAVIELLPHRRFDARFFRTMGLAKGNHWVRVLEPSSNVPSLLNVALTLTRPGHTKKNRFYRDRNAIFEPAAVLRAVDLVWPRDATRTSPIDSDVALLPAETGFLHKLALWRAHRKFLLALAGVALAAPFLSASPVFWCAALLLLGVMFCV